jgi:hypothetical protein
MMLGCDAEKFFARSKNFGENVLHNFNNCVQLRTSDNGFHAFQSNKSMQDISIRLQLGCELPELPRNGSWFFSEVIAAVSLKWCVSGRIT